jgi:surface protein
MSKRDLYIKASASASEDWVRPADWLPMPTVVDTDDTFVGLHAIFPEGQNYCAFRFTTSTGQYRVDWGDGTIDLVDSNVTAQHDYDYATYDPTDATLSSRGYKQAIITVTAVSGLLRTCNFQQRFVTTPAQNQAYSTGFLDCILSMPNANTGISIVFGGSTVGHRRVERFNVLTTGGASRLDNLFSECIRLEEVPLFNTSNITVMLSMFSGCRSLQSVPLFNTSNVTNMQGMFLNCSSLQSVPLFDTSNATSMQTMFSGCNSLQTVPLFNTNSVTLMLSMFVNCSSLQSVPLFDTSNATSMLTMFNGCSSLQSVPLFDTSNVTNMQNMFNGCTSLKSIPALSTTSITTTSGLDFGANFTRDCLSLTRCELIFARTVSMVNNQLSRTALVEIFTNLVDRSSTTAANIDISGNWGASALTTAERDIALNKNWTITG